MPTILQINPDPGPAEYHTFVPLLAGIIRQKAAGKGIFCLPRTGYSGRGKEISPIHLSFEGNAAAQPALSGRCGREKKLIKLSLLKSRNTLLVRAAKTTPRWIGMAGYDNLNCDRVTGNDWKHRKKSEFRTDFRLLRAKPVGGPFLSCVSNTRRYVL